MGADAAIAPLDYGCALNWVAEESRADVSAASYDLFYLYPTLVADRERDLLEVQAVQALLRYPEHTCLFFF